MPYDFTNYESMSILKKLFFLRLHKNFYNVLINKINLKYFKFERKQVYIVD